MTLSQHKFREIVLQLLYSQEMGHPQEALMTELMMAELAVSKKNVRSAQERMLFIQDRFEEIDNLITSVSTSYAFERIQIITKNILRLAVFEIFFDDQIPPKVAIAEAIRLSRKFNTPESADFVNAILDNLYQSSLGSSIDTQKIAKTTQALMEDEQKNLEAAQDVLLNKIQSDENNEIE